MITLYSAATPNGYKASIMLEEVALPYQLKVLDFQAQEQKSASFLKLNPNGRIPTIVDHDEDDFVVIESGSILIYLAEKTDQFLPHDPKKRSEVLQWLMFQMGGVGPMQGQANVFLRYAPEKIPYAIERYQKETRRLYEVLNKRLEGREYLVDQYSIADIATWPWVSLHDWCEVSVDGLTHLQKWMARIAERDACQKGIMQPPRPPHNPEKAKKEVGKMLV